MALKIVRKYRVSGTAGVSGASYAQVVDEQGRRIEVKLAATRETPTDAAFLTRAALIFDALRVPQEPLDPIYTETEIEALLVQKGYLEPGQDLSELPSVVRMA